MPFLPSPPPDETEKMDNPWIWTAAKELYEIRKRWHLTSNRQFAQALERRIAALGAEEV